MNVPVLDRTNVVTLLLGAMLFLLPLSFISTGLYFVAEPAMNVVQERANPLVSLGATILNLAAGAVVYVLLGRAASFGAASPSSIWGRNAAIIQAARLVAIVYLALAVASWFLAEVRSFFQIQVGNFAQVDMLSGAGDAFVMLGLPLIGIVLLLAFGPGLVKKTVRS